MSRAEFHAAEVAKYGDSPSVYEGRCMYCETISHLGELLEIDRRPQVTKWIHHNCLAELDDIIHTIDEHNQLAEYLGITNQLEK